MINFYNTVGGMGRLPWAPGTWGSLAGWGFFSYFPFSINIFIVLTVFSVMTIHRALAADHFQKTDPKEIVIDEFLGQTLVLFFVPHEFLAFLLFRFFDIFKPWPISWFEKICSQRQSTMALGVLLDDYLASVLSILSFIGLRFLF